MSALTGIRIVELAESVAGEYCGKLLADFGAEVIKIERPDCGSPIRAMAPIIGDTGGPERSALFAYPHNPSQRAVSRRCPASLERHKTRREPLRNISSRTKPASFRSEATAEEPMVCGLSAGGRRIRTSRSRLCQTSIPFASASESSSRSVPGGQFSRRRSHCRPD